MAKLVEWFLILMFFLFLSGTCLADSMSWHTLGFRYGTNEGIDKKTDLQRYELFGILNLPWSWQISSNIDLDTRFIAAQVGFFINSFIGAITEPKRMPTYTICQAGSRWKKKEHQYEKPCNQFSHITYLNI